MREREATARREEQALKDERGIDIVGHSGVSNGNFDLLHRSACAHKKKRNSRHTVAHVLTDADRCALLCRAAPGMQTLDEAAENVVKRTMFTDAEDKGKLVDVKNGTVWFKQRWRQVDWIGGKSTDGTEKKITSVEDHIGGEVSLSDGCCFKNPALKPMPRALAALDLKTIEDAKAKTKPKCLKGVLSTNWNAVARVIINVLTLRMVSAAAPEPEWPVCLDCDCILDDVDDSAPQFCLGCWTARQRTTAQPAPTPQPTHSPPTSSPTMPSSPASSTPTPTPTAPPTSAPQRPCPRSEHCTKPARHRGTTT